MTKTTKTSARTIVAAALAAVLAAGSACTPALAATQAPAADAPLAAQSLAGFDGMSQGEAVWIARNYLGIAPEEVSDLDCDLEWYAGTACWEVEIETWGSPAEHHVMVDASSGAVLGSWVEW